MWLLHLQPQLSDPVDSLHRQHLRSAAHRMPPKCNNCGFQDGLEGGVDRMQLISFKEYGITWERVFAIVHPGYEPIPDECEHPEPLSSGRTENSTDFEELSTGSSMDSSREDTESLQRIQANLRGLVGQNISNRFIDDQIRTSRALPESGQHIEGESMLPEANSSYWPPQQPLGHRMHPQENGKRRRTSPLPGYIDTSHSSNIDATGFPLNLTATGGDGSYNTGFLTNQPSTSDFPGLTCHCVCHHRPLEPCWCFSDCSFRKTPSQAPLG